MFGICSLYVLCSIPRLSRRKNLWRAFIPFRLDEDKSGPRSTVPFYAPPPRGWAASLWSELLPAFPAIVARVTEPRLHLRFRAVKPPDRSGLSLSESKFKETRISLNPEQILRPERVESRHTAWSFEREDGSIVTEAAVAGAFCSSLRSSFGPSSPEKGLEENFLQL